MCAFVYILGFPDTYVPILCQAFLYLLSYLILYNILQNCCLIIRILYEDVKCEIDRALNEIYLQLHMQKQLVLKLRGFLVVVSIFLIMMIKYV